MTVSLNIVAYEKRFLCSDFATMQRKRVIKRSLKHQKTDRSQTNRRNIIRCSSECRIYRSRSNGWRGCDSNPLSLGLTLPPRCSRSLLPLEYPLYFDLTFSPQFAPSLLLKRLKRLAVPDVRNLLELSENYNTRNPTPITIRRGFFFFLLRKMKFRWKYEIKWDCHFYRKLMFKLLSFFFHRCNINPLH